MLKHLTLEEMVALLQPLVGATKRRKAFLSIKEVATWHPEVVEAYEAVRAVQPVDTSRSPALLKLEQKGALVDNRHDHLGRALSFGIIAGIGRSAWLPRFRTSSGRLCARRCKESSSRTGSRSSTPRGCRSRATPCASRSCWRTSRRLAVS